jgi:predicted small secreted protein
VAIFGIKAENEEERLKEMDGENEWIFSANEIQAHIDYARKSSLNGEKLIRKLKDRTKKKPKIAGSWCWSRMEVFPILAIC